MAATAVVPLARCCSCKMAWLLAWLLVPHQAQCCHSSTLRVLLTMAKLQWSLLLPMCKLI